MQIQAVMTLLQAEDGRGRVRRTPQKCLHQQLDDSPPTQRKQQDQ